INRQTTGVDPPQPCVVGPGTEGLREERAFWKRGRTRKFDPNRKFQVYERICGVRCKADHAGRLAASYRRLHSQPRAYASAATIVCALAITGISGVGEKPSSAGARTAWASARRPVA